MVKNYGIYKMEDFMLSLLITVLAGSFFLIGNLISNLNKKNNLKLINFSLGMSFSVLILLLIIDIIPETLELFTDYKILGIIGGSLIGIGLLLIVEKFVPHHHDNPNIDNQQLVHIGIMTSIALIIHNLVEGMGLFSVASVSVKSGLVYALAIGLHNIPFGIKISAIFKDNKFALWLWTGLLTFSTFMGGLIIFIFKNSLNDFVLGILLSMTVGIILYIIFGELIHAFKKKYLKETIIGAVVGIILMIIGVLL